MGEYHSRDGKAVCKLGTYEEMLYATREEIEFLVPFDDGRNADLRAILNYPGTFYRIPWDSERGPMTYESVVSRIDKREPFQYRQAIGHEFAEMLSDVEHDSVIINLRHHNGGGGVNRRIPCPLSVQQKTNEWGGVAFPAVEFVSEKYHPTLGHYTVFGCPYCGRHFRMGKESADRFRFLLMQKAFSMYLPHSPDNFSNRDALYLAELAMHVFGSNE
jgi:hypothetical protein